MKVSMLFCGAKIPTSNLTIQEKDANPSLSIDQRIILLPAGKESAPFFSAQLIKSWITVAVETVRKWLQHEAADRAAPASSLIRFVWC